MSGGLRGGCCTRFGVSDVDATWRSGGVYRFVAGSSNMVWLGVICVGDFVMWCGVSEVFQVF